MRETCGEWKGVLDLNETLGPLAVMCSIFCKDFRLDDEDSLSILRDLTLLMSPWGSEGGGMTVLEHTASLLANGIVLHEKVWS